MRRWARARRFAPWAGQLRSAHQPLGGGRHAGDHGTTATYFAFSEDVLTRLARRPSRTGYDRIAELRTRPIAGRQLIDQRQQKLEQILAVSRL